MFRHFGGSVLSRRKVDVKFEQIGISDTMTPQLWGFQYDLTIDKKSDFLTF